ncbi:MAG: CHASE3 domain-containing protein [Gammaproteobacteria bacterium]
MSDQDKAPAKGWRAEFRLVPAPVIITLAALLLVSISILVLGEVTLRNSEGYAQQTAEVLRRLDASARLKGLLIDAETGQRGFLLTGNAHTLCHSSGRPGNLNRRLLNLKALCPTPALKTQVARIKDVATERLGVASTSITLWETGEHENAINMVREGRGQVLSDELREKIGTLEEMSRGELQELRRHQQPNTFRTRFATLVSSLLAIGLLLVIIRMFMRQAAFQRAEADAAYDEAQRMQNLVDERTSELSRLSSHLQEVSEREKAELARNLHDELGGLLTAARMDISWLLGATATMDPEIHKKLEQVNDGLTESMDIKRRVVESLRPALLDHFGLPTALQNYFDESCKKAGLTCNTNIPEEMADLPQDLAIALFRVGQESLTNIIRHAKARNVHMSVESHGEIVRVIVVDDGVGMDLNSPTFRASHGITGMRHRVNALGGTFKLSSTPGTGTRLEITVPSTPPPQSDAK